MQRITEEEAEVLGGGESLYAQIVILTLTASREYEMWLLTWPLIGVFCFATLDQSAFSPLFVFISLLDHGDKDLS